MRSNPALGPALADAAMRAHQAALEAAAGAGEASYDRAEALFRQARLQACRRRRTLPYPNPIRTTASRAAPCLRLPGHACEYAVLVARAGAPGRLHTSCPVLRWTALAYAARAPRGR